MNYFDKANKDCEPPPLSVQYTAAPGTANNTTPLCVPDVCVSVCM